MLKCLRFLKRVLDICHRLRYLTRKHMRLEQHVASVSLLPEVWVASLPQKGHQPFVELPSVPSNVVPVLEPVGPLVG